MTDRPWELWDRPGVADAIQRSWNNQDEILYRLGLVRSMADFIRPAESFLEVGCGTGLIYYFLKNLTVITYTGIDGSETMLEKARKSNPEGKFLKGDGYHLEYPDQSFDVVAAIDVLQHVPDIRGIIREMVRVSKRLAIFTLCSAPRTVFGKELIAGNTFSLNRYSKSHAETLVDEASHNLPFKKIEIPYNDSHLWVLTKGPQADLDPFPGEFLPAERPPAQRTKIAVLIPFHSYPEVLKLTLGTLLRTSSPKWELNIHVGVHSNYNHYYHQSLAFFDEIRQFAQVHMVDEIDWLGEFNSCWFRYSVMHAKNLINLFKAVRFYDFDYLLILDNDLYFREDLVARCLERYPNADLIGSYLDDRKELNEIKRELDGRPIYVLPKLSGWHVLMSRKLYYQMVKDDYRSVMPRFLEPPQATEYYKEIKPEKPLPLFMDVMGDFFFRTTRDWGMKFGEIKTGEFEQWVRHFRQSSFNFGQRSLNEKFQAKILAIADLYRKEFPDGLDEIKIDEQRRGYMREICSRQIWQTVRWNGTPFQQIPEDIVAIGEAIHQARADAVVEIGIYAGGGLEFYSTVLSANPKGLVVGVDVASGAVRAVDRFPGRVKVLTGDSIDPRTVKAVRDMVGDRRTLVILDGDHTAVHVARELELYSPLVSPGSYLIVMDGAIKDLVGVPVIPDDASTNNPETAVAEFLSRHPEFERDLSKNRFGVTLAPGGFLKRL